MHTPHRTALTCALALTLNLTCTQAWAQSAAPAPVAAVATSVDGIPEALAQRVDDAFIALFPLYEMGRARFNAAVHPLNPTPSPPNGAPVNRRTLIDHTARDVTTPNNDTLYSATWLDLHDSPVRVHVPRVDRGRYWSVALLDAYTNNFAILGSQSLGAGPLDVTVVGPQWRGKLPTGRVLRAPTNDVQLVGRFLVNGPQDLATVHRVQDGIRIHPLNSGSSTVPQWVMPRTSTDPENFLAVVNEMLVRNPPDRAQAIQFKQWADLGVGLGAYDFGRLPQQVQAAWRSRLPVLHERIKVGLQYGARLVDGWSVPSPNVGQFGSDYLLRAAVAYGGLSALAASEAIYLNLETDPSGAPLDGRKAWRLKVPPVEARAFWSLSMYEKTPDGRLFFAANPLARYAIGDRTPGLQREPDGSFTILLQHEPPTDTRNWLPTPAGSYAITLRAYLPTDAMRQGKAPLPRLEPTEP